MILYAMLFAMLTVFEDENNSFTFVCIGVCDSTKEEIRNFNKKYEHRISVDPNIDNDSRKLKRFKQSDLGESF